MSMWPSLSTGGEGGYKPEEYSASGTILYILNQVYHTHSQVYRWFCQSGLSQITILDPGVSFIGIRLAEVPL